MGIFDSFKRKKTDKPAEKIDAKKPEKVDFAKKSKELDEHARAVVAPDGRLVNAPKKDASRQKKVKPKKEDTGNAFHVLVRPLITEKGSFLGTYNQYLFAVASDANKIEIRKAIKKVYGVLPVKVNIVNVSGKSIRYGRTEGRTRNWKKAIITLAPGDTIEIQEGL